MKLIDKSCKQCGNEFHPKEQSQILCSFGCAQKWKIGHKGKPQNRETRICIWCGKPVTRCVSNFHNPAIAFCNRQCMGEWQFEFRGGTSRYNGNWYKAREQSLLIANGVCQKCKRKPVVAIHHRLPIRYFATDQNPHFPSNLLALCFQCHKKEHRKLKQVLPLLDLLHI